MSKYQDFIFKDYSFDSESKVLSLHYSFDNTIEFCETYKFDFEYVNYDEAVLDRAIQALFFIAGTSYFKTYLSPNIVVERGELDQSAAEFFSKTYKNGLGEFFFVNNLDPRFPINFPVTTDTPLVKLSGESSGLLVAIGGGKDSLVSVELLRNSAPDLFTWSLSHKSQLKPLINAIGLPHLWVERTWDRSLLDHNEGGAYNGHIPISAIFACVSTVVSVLSGRRDAVFSNENSANEPDLVYKGLPVNHQYSKSLEFEKDYQEYLGNTIRGLRYYSYLRPFSEVRIAEIFAKVGFDKYRGVYSSCNRAYTHDSNHIFWCGECAKCAFTFLALAPFVDPRELEAIWGKNLLLDAGLGVTYRKLLGIDGDKPLDCVGEIKESRTAMRMAQKLYPELHKYEFGIPEDYDYAAMSPSSMPEGMLGRLKDEIGKLWS